MAVSVTVYRVPNTGSEKAIDHPDADSLRIDEGHLVLMSHGGGEVKGKTVAAYAPGSWVSAKVTD